jgi:phage shock protein PspC (stress-responsive transcriptional regulator)
VSGLAGGLADYLNVDPSLVRLGLVAATLVTGPGLPVAYVIGWWVVPKS